MRRWTLLVVMALVTAACSQSADPTTTTAATTTTPTSTTTTTAGDGRIQLRANGPAFIVEGERGPYVAALQAYLVCTGHGQLVEDGPSVSVDGVFGPITADAVAYYQAELGRIPTGDPDEETFASLGRDCTAERDVLFEEGASAAVAAGSTGPGDTDVLVIDGTGEQLATISVVEGGVTFSVVAADGTSLVEAAGLGGWQGELPTAQQYRILVEAASTTSYQLGIELRSPNVVATDFGPMSLEPDGVAVANFGDDPVNTVAVMALLLGPPFLDTDWQTDVPGCTGANRHITWIVQAAASGDEHPAVLTLDFTDIGGTPSFAQYSYRSFDLVGLDPVAQGLTTGEGISIGSTLEAFSEAHGDPEFFDEVRGLTRFGGGMLAGIETSDGEGGGQVWYLGAGDDGCEDFG